jgi:hypothetical protein
MTRGLKSLPVWIVGAALLATATPMLAHHSFSAEFDANRPITLTGTVKKMLWSNPHGFLYVETKTPDGKVVEWQIEMAGPTSLMRRGWRKEHLPIGVQVTVKGFLAKDGSASANANTVLLPDGRELFAGSSGTGAPYDNLKPPSQP